MTSRPTTDPPQADRLDDLYEGLRSISGRLFARERGGHTLQPTAVAHEAWIRLAAHGESSGDAAGEPASDPSLPLIVRTVRNVLVDHARRRDALRRGGGAAKLSLDDADVPVGDDPAGLVILSDAIDELARRSPRAAAVVELKVFAGCEEAEVAECLDCSRATVTRDWRTARAWLRRALADG